MQKWVRAFRFCWIKIWLLSPGISSDYPRELLRNQLWHGANFLSKGLTLFLLTPLMLRLWGKEQYGVYALCSSLFVSLALLDGGVRSLTRVRLAARVHQPDSPAPGLILAQGLITFFLVCASALLFALIAGWGGRWDTLLQLPAGGQNILIGSGIFTALWMGSVLALEPVAAAGHLSRVKSANTWGVIFALPLCALVLILGGGPFAVITVMTGCLMAPNLILFIRSGIWRELSLPRLPAWPSVARNTLRHGFPYYLTTVALIAKTHGLTFFISALAGPAEAGIFYVLLRLSEILSNVAGASSETSVATLAGVPSAERPRLFQKAWAWISLTCFHGALVLVFWVPRFWDIWLPNFTSLPPSLWPALALFGFAGAWSQMAVNASMGLDRVRSAAAIVMLEAILTVTGALWGYDHGEFTGLFFGGCLAVLATLAQSFHLRHALGETFRRTWLQPWIPLLPGLALSAATLYAGSWLTSPWLALLSLLVPVTVISLQILAWRKQV